MKDRDASIVKIFLIKMGETGDGSLSHTIFRSM